MVKVLSPGTRRHDRDVKLDGYRAIASVHEILLVGSEERRVQLWRRDGSRWIVEDLIGDATFRLEIVDTAIPRKAVSENVAFEELQETG